MMKWLLLGLFLGLFIGGGIVYLIFPRIVTKQQNIFTKSTIVDTVFVEKQKIVYKTQRIEIKKTKGELLEEERDSINSDSLTVVDSSFINIDVVDTKVANLDYDSLSKVNDTLSQKQELVVSSSGRKIQISKDELIYSVIIYPQGNASDFYCNTDSELDSLLVGNYSSKSDDKGMYVEFWSSPLHATGYQLSKSKLLLYGFYEYKNVKLKYLKNGKLMLSYFENNYVLSCGEDFAPLVIKKR